MSISLGTVSERTKGWDPGTVLLDQQEKINAGAFVRYNLLP